MWVLLLLLIIGMCLFRLVGLEMMNSIIGLIADGSRSQEGHGTLLMTGSRPFGT